MPEQPKEILQQTEAFQQLTGQELAPIEEFSELRSFTRGHRLFQDGGSAASLWVLSEGTVDLRFELPGGRETSDEQTISTLGENQIFGWSSMIPPYKYKLSAYCISNQCRLLVIDAGKLMEYFRAHPDIGYRVTSGMIRVVGKRFQQLQASAGQAAFAGARVTVHMGTCGIAAGAREVMKALSEEVAGSIRQNVQVTTGGCLGFCRSEPNVTVHLQDQEPVIYQHMDEKKMRRVFAEHVIGGRVQDDLVLHGGQSC
ncbi:MAG: cyclic nucleotide-binding domain-containing protein [Desulfobacterales bacterium]